MKNKKKALIIPAISAIKEAIKSYADTYDFTLGSYKHLEIEFTEDGVQVFHKGIDLKDYDKVWLSSVWGTRDIAYAIHLYLEAYNIPNTGAEQACSKVVDQMKFALAGLRTPNTWYSSRHKLSPYLDNIEEICKYPMVIKDTMGSRGKYASYISDAEDLVTTSLSLPASKRYLVQEFVPNECEWGILVANSVIVSAEKSYPKKGEYRNNSCNGATEVFLPVEEIPKHIQELTLISAKTLDLTWCRVDILEDKNTGKPYVLEVNRFPGITSKSDEVRGVEKFLSSILEDSKQQLVGS